MKRVHSFRANVLIYFSIFQYFVALKENFQRKSKWNNFIGWNWRQGTSISATEIAPFRFPRKVFLNSYMILESIDNNESIKLRKICENLFFLVNRIFRIYGSVLTRVNTGRWKPQFFIFYAVLVKNGHKFIKSNCPKTFQIFVLIVFFRRFSHYRYVIIEKVS